MVRLRRRTIRIRSVVEQRARAPALALIFGAAALASCQDSTTQRGRDRPAPVEVASIERGSITLHRSFSGTLEARARIVVAPKVGGRIVRLNVDLADPVSRGQVVAELDDDEFKQTVRAARAELAVARATLSEAEASLDASDRELQRYETLRKRGIASESQLDAARAEKLTHQAKREMAAAQVRRATATLQTALIRLGYTQVKATWAEGDDSRVVAERHGNAGDTVAANTPLFTVVELDPITGVIHVSESDYAHLHEAQAVTLTTDAYQGKTFVGTVERVAPTFRTGSRQARVELRLNNADQRLKPGMFVQAKIALERHDDVQIVPQAALTVRDDTTGVFLVHEGADGTTVRWREVRTGIRSGERVEVLGDSLSGQVVTLGHQLIDDGSRVTLTKRSTRDRPRRTAVETEQAKP
jgi:RND family efflux transporter MFP subunit